MMRVIMFTMRLVIMLVVMFMLVTMIVVMVVFMTVLVVVVMVVFVTVMLMVAMCVMVVMGNPVLQTYAHIPPIAYPHTQQVGPGELFGAKPIAHPLDLHGRMFKTGQRG